MAHSTTIPGRDAPRRRGRATRRSRLLTGLLVVIAILVLSAGITVRVADLHFQTVVSNSMQPTASAGDVAITQAVPIGSLRVGDVVSFYPPAASRPVLHRITSLEDGVVTTRGDANPVDDPWRVRLGGPAAYRLVTVVPFVGWLTELQRPALLLAGVLIGLAILRELWKEVTARATRPQPQPDP